MALGDDGRWHATAPAFALSAAPFDVSPVVRAVLQLR